MFERAREQPMRIAYAEGEEERVLRAVQVALDEGLARPILIGRRKVVENRIEKLGLRLKIGGNVDLVDPQNDPRYNDLLAGLSRADGAQRRVAGPGADRRAHQLHGDRRADGATAAKPTA